MTPGAPARTATAGTAKAGGAKAGGAKAGPGPSRTTGSWPRLLVVTAVVAVLTVLAALPVGRIYHGDLLVRLLIGAAVAPVLLSALCHRLPAYPVAPLSVLALGGYTLLAVRVSAHSAGLTGQLTTLWTDAARNGIPRLLTALIPVEPQPDTVLVPVVATWLAGLAAAELAIRYRRVLAGYAAPTALYAGALVLVGPNARPMLWSALLYAAVAVAGLAATGRPGPAGLPDLSPQARLTLRVRLTAGAAVALAAIVALAFAVGPALADRVHGAPTDPRRYVAPPSLDAQDENPLIRLSGWALNPDQRLFDADITGAGGSGPDAQVRVRLAVLSDYDGVNWLVHGDYREAGRVLPAINGPGAVAPEPATPEIKQTITVDELDGRLLPAAASPHAVDGVRVAYDQSTGTLIRPDGLATGLTYTVYSQPSTVEVNELPAADVPSGPTFARYLGLGAQPPDAMKRLADQLGGDTADPYQKAQAIADFLSQHYTLSSDAPSGHAYPNLNFFLFGARNAGGQRGTTEQFAAAFGVIGRILGLPTRVVVGFQARPGRATVRGRDAFAWPEVLFTGVGWVPFDPLPQPNSSPRPVESDFLPKVDKSTPPPTDAPTIAASAPSTKPSRSPSPVAAPASGVPVGPLAGSGAALVGVLVGLVIALLWLRRAQRDRRLARGSPADRVVGAWQEVIDALRLAGRPPGAHLAATELVDFAALAASGKSHSGRVQLPAPSLGELAGLVNTVAFTQQVTTDDAARRAGVQAAAYVGELRARRSWWRRLLWSVDPRPLRWARRR